MLIIGGWSVAWWMIAGSVEKGIDNAVANAKRSGITLDCANRTVSGWPFRISVACAPLRVAQQDGTSITLAAARGVALVYRPRHIILEADSPAEASLRGAVPGAAAWSLGRASVILGDNGPDAVSISLTDPRVSGFGTLGLADVAAKTAQLHLRRSPKVPGDIDVALRLEQLRESPVANGSPVDVDVMSTVAAALSPVSVDATNRENGVRIDRAAITSAATIVGIGGSLALDPSGHANGTLELDVTEPSGLKELLMRLFPARPEMMDSIQGAVLALGKKTEENGKDRYRLPVKIDRGNAAIGLIPLGRIPAINRP